MAIIYSYPSATPTDSDTVIGTQQTTDGEGDNLTRTFTLGGIAGFVNNKVDLLIGGDTGAGTINISTQTLSIVGTANEIETTAAGQTLTVGLPNDVTILGSLQVNKDTEVGGALDVVGLTDTGTLYVQGSSEMQGDLNMASNNINSVADPLAAQDAATKAYVDASNLNQVTGGGEPNKIPKWTGAGSPSNVLGDSIISELANEITIAGDLKVGVNNAVGGLYSVAIGENNSVLGNRAIGVGFNNIVSGNRCGGLGANNTVRGGQVWATGDGNDVGIDLLDVGGNIIASGFNNNVKSGNSCVVGTGNTLTNTTQSAGINTNFVLGSANTLNDVMDGIAIGFNNTINNDDSCIFGKNNTTSATDTYAVGKGNTLTSINDYAFGLNNNISGNGVIAMAIGQANVLSGKHSYAFGRELVDGGEDDTVILGRFNAAPTATGRIVFGTGFNDTTGRKNAIEIQAGDGAQSGLLFPALKLSASYNSDAHAASAGVETGELYRSNNQLKINTNQFGSQDARNNEGFVFLTPRTKTLINGNSFSYQTNWNLLKLSWSGGNGAASVVLPSAGFADTENRVLQCLTDGTFNSNTSINFNSSGGLINGSTTKTITGAYQSIKFWSDGTQWYILNESY